MANNILWLSVLMGWKRNLSWQNYGSSDTITYPEPQYLGGFRDWTANHEAPFDSCHLNMNGSLHFSCISLRNNSRILVWRISHIRPTYAASWGRADFAVANLKTKLCLALLAQGKVLIHRPKSIYCNVGMNLNFCQHSRNQIEPLIGQMNIYF